MVENGLRWHKHLKVTICCKHAVRQIAYYPMFKSHVFDKRKPYIKHGFYYYSVKEHYWLSITEYHQNSSPYLPENDFIPWSCIASWAYHRKWVSFYTVNNRRWIEHCGVPSNKDMVSEVILFDCIVLSRNIFVKHTAWQTSQFSSQSKKNATVNCVKCRMSITAFILSFSKIISVFTQISCLIKMANLKQVSYLSKHCILN